MSNYNYGPLEHEMAGGSFLETYETAPCDKCGQDFPINQLQYVACEGVFCYDCELSLIIWMEPEHNVNQ